MSNLSDLFNHETIKRLAEMVRECVNGEPVLTPLARGGLNQNLQSFEMEARLDAAKHESVDLVKLQSLLGPERASLTRECASIQGRLDGTPYDLQIVFAV
jgi:hypothetical protein